MEDTDYCRDLKKYLSYILVDNDFTLQKIISSDYDEIKIMFNIDETNLSIITEERWYEFRVVVNNYLKCLNPKQCFL